MLSGRRVLSWSVAVAALALITPNQAHAADAPKPGTGVGPCGKWTCAGVGVPGKPESGKPGGGGGGGGEAGREDGGEKSRWQCVYKLADPQPPAGSLDWDGHKPGDGAVYEEICAFDEHPDTAAFAIRRMVWAAYPPTAPAVDPAVLAQEAVDKMLLRAPEIGITPKPGGKGVVGMPVYMWTEKGPETYGPNVASASAGGITVTATAKVSKIVWNMGDSKTVTCTTAGTPYKAEYGKKPSPDCGHRYNVPSSTTGSGKFHVTATSTWTIDWVATSGPTGQLTEVRNSAVDITVAEVQVLN
jgi:hypothetical protein